MLYQWTEDNAKYGVGRRAWIFSEGAAENECSHLVLIFSNIHNNICLDRGIQRRERSGEDWAERGDV